MAELVGGAILTAVIQVLVERLASPGVTNFFRNNRQLHHKLEVKLRSANSLLNDAEDKQVKNDNVKKWVDDLNEVLSDADNAIDKVNTKALSHKVEGKALLTKVISTSLDPFDKLEEIIGRLEFLLGEVDNLGLRADVPSKRLSRSPAPLIKDPSHVYGRDGDKKAILDLLFSEHSVGHDKISVIPIVGMGGVGKTTLARLVYNDTRVMVRFEHRAWVTVSDDFDVLKIAKLVLEGLSGKKCEVTELGKLGEELEAFLGGNKFFLVLDDVWNENYTLWNSLKSYFQVGADGSKIIVTTRSGQIGSQMGSVGFHSLTPMEDDDCWKLFQKHAFRSVEECTKQLETVGIEIVRKCKGLPIAVMSLAGLLHSVSDPKEWEKVLKNDVWESARKGDDEILPSLWLSYSYLPSHVKRCFAYCSIFLKDYKFDKEKIMLLWMAEGLVQGEDMEDVAEEYFNTLVSRLLLQRSAIDTSSFIMHDLVHDLATFVAGKGFCMRLNEGDALDCLTFKTRHLLCYSDLDELKELSGGNNLRTFISNSYTSNRVVRKMLKKFGCLRVLCLSRDVALFDAIRKVPDSIGKLKHLRYLDLTGSDIFRLPDTICKLYNLQTLLLRRCHYLTHLPAKMEKLINLRHLDISETDSLKEIPQSVYNMKALRTITKFAVGSGNSVNRLKKFPHSGGCFEISGLENIVDTNDVVEVKFKEKSLVTKLILKWDSKNGDVAKDRAILDAFQPHPNLKKLNINGYGGIEFSNWVADHSFSNLTKVTIFDCNHCIQLPAFGQLPCLKDLGVIELRSVETIGLEFYCSSGATPFPRLKSLKIHFLVELQSFSFEAQGAFPCLEELSLLNSPKLKTICLDPIHRLPSLKKISIELCPNLEFSGLPSCLKELSIWKCDVVYSQRMQWGLKALKELTIYECNVEDSFPEEGLLPSTLTDLKIWNIPNMKSLNGKGFQHLTSLKKLVLFDCPKLESLPEEKLPASLELLKVWRCPILAARLKREEWHKISHIPNVEYMTEKACGPLSVPSLDHVCNDSSDNEMKVQVVSVIGGSGFIASWIIKILVARGYTVKASV